MKFLIVGLGNPGTEYNHTRHNIGFDVLDLFAKEKGVSWESVRHGWRVEASHKGRKLIFIKPSTYMNLSGKAVAYWMQSEKVSIENVLVVVDDLSMELGKLRIRPKGSDAGHNGLKSIAESLGSQNYPRLKFGVGNNFPKGRQVEFVLGTWDEDELALVNLASEKSISLIKEYIFGPKSLSWSPE